MRPALVLVSMLSLAAGPPQPQQSTGTGSAAGRVFDAVTGHPIAGAFVRLSQTRDGYRTETQTTGPDGQFHFTGLAAGTFSFAASAETYLTGSVGKRRARGEEVWITLASAEHRDDLAIAMFRGATLSGRIADEHGTPIAGFWVEAWPRTRQPMLFHNEPPRLTAKTDSDGRYRIKDVLPGDYVVVARVWHGTRPHAALGRSKCDPPAPPPPLTLMTGSAALPAAPAKTREALERPIGSLYSELTNGLRQPDPLADGRPTTYRTLFFPGVPELTDASSVNVGVGEFRASLDIQLSPVIGTKVSGEFTNLQGRSSGGSVRLRLAADPYSDGSEADTWLEPGRGAFTLLDVPVGRYYLEPTLYAAPPDCDVISLDPDSKLTRVPLAVPVTGLENVVVPLATSTKVTGSVVFNGTSKPPANVDLYLFRLDASPEATGPSGDIASGRLTMHGVLPGSYELHASDNAINASWWLQSVTVGGHDVTGLPIVVGPRGIQDLVVIMADRPSSIRGTVTGVAQQPVTDATVVLFPADRNTWPNARIGSLRFQTSRALRGVYEFENVPAGDYFIAVVDETTMDLWPSAGFLQHIAASASRVKLKPRSIQTLRLTIAP